MPTPDSAPSFAASASVPEPTLPITFDFSLYASGSVNGQDGWVSPVTSSNPLNTFPFAGSNALMSPVGESDNATRSLSIEGLNPLLPFTITIVHRSNLGDDAEHNFTLAMGDIVSPGVWVNLQFDAGSGALGVVTGVNVGDNTNSAGANFVAYAVAVDHVIVFTFDGTDLACSVDGVPQITYTVVDPGTPPAAIAVTLTNLGGATIQGIRSITVAQP